MKNLKLVLLPLLFMFSLAIAASGNENTTVNTPQSKNIDKKKVLHRMNCHDSNCSNSAHIRRPDQIQ
ncbi:hypothetical protein JCM19314_2617 [Nonlabens ulvanivorans]|uniref:Uncharacterized protein n=1 Tax=Nonlabens ulvanivorans TaxID=906888 RepID=A0A090QSZ0_NONUL|nr:hypothetical protein [Nonlabens ulvanivorans]GAK98586.1 hypothetical protein JCM19314_2617 [Nonlabens ulvanivorans]